MFNAPMMVAWNGSSEACVALRAAVPLLAAARKVLSRQRGRAFGQAALRFSRP